MAENWVESLTEFESTPAGQAKRWDVEMSSAWEDQRYWKEMSNKVVNRFIDNRQSQGRDVERRDGNTRVNLFTANIATLRALLYGNPPKVDVKRRYTDPGDQPARVAAEIIQRLLNNDIQREDDTYASTLEHTLDDRFLVGIGVGRCRYTAEVSKKKVDAIPDSKVNGKVRKGAPAFEKEEKSSEDVEISYVHWRDFRWSPARVWSDVRWIAFRILMTRDQCKKRFGEDKGNKIPLTAKSEKIKHTGDDEGEKTQPWNRAEIWEIWSKEEKKVIWWVKGYPEILDTKDDPLGLDGFFPIARPMFANLTTTKLIPTPDFILAQDLYDEVDLVSTRITLLERAVAARGVYDKTSPEVERLLTEATTNQLIPVDNFAVFAERGGLKSVIDWMPLDQIVGALDKLREYRGELINLLFQVTGMSDIVRGESDQKNVTATEQAIKAKFASTRVQALQNEFARFASDLQSIKAEIISKHFDPVTILERANVKYMTGADPQVALEAVKIIKSDIYQYRIEVKPETVSMTDMAAVKQERSEFLMAMATFLQSSQPITAAAPWTAPFLLQMLQWAMASYRGGQTIEGVLDQMVMMAQQEAVKAANTPPPPDPKVQQIQLKMQMDQQKNQMDMALKQIELQYKMIEKHLELRAQEQGHQIDIQKKQADLALDAQQGQQDMALSQEKMALASEENRMEHEQAQATHQMDMQQAHEKHTQAMQQARQQATAKPAPKGKK